MGMTFAEKILAQKAGLPATVPGQIVDIQPDVALSHDNSAAIIDLFKEMGATRVFDPKMHAIILDHATPAPTTKHAQNHKQIREFVKEQGIPYFHDIGRGICHQVLVEEGLALPGEVVLGADSHTPHAGVMGAFATGIGRTEMASIWAIGRLWLRVPESMKIVVTGQLPKWVTSKDLVLTIIGKLGVDGGLYRSVEWHGDTIQAMSVSQRSTLTNLMGEMGVKNSYIPPDQVTFDYLKARTKRAFTPMYPDADAVYEMTVEIDASQLEPVVAAPHAVDNVHPVSEVQGTPIDQAYLGTCTNCRLDDLAVAADLLKCRKIASRVRMIVIPASSEVYLAALKLGYLETLAEAGAVIESPGCGACMGNHMGVPAVGEVCISSANRNFKGRMGTKESDVYLASPAVVAASALAGTIAHPDSI